MEKYKKVIQKVINLKYQLRHGMKSLNYLIVHIHDYFEYNLKTWRKDWKSFNKINVNKIENRIKFKIKAGYYLKLLTPETMKSFRSNTSKITKDKNGENVPHLEITEAVWVHCNIVNNDYQQDSKVLYIFNPNKSFGQMLDISQKKNYLSKNI